MTVEQLERRIAMMEIQIRDLQMKGKTLLSERDRLARRIDALENKPRAGRPRKAEVRPAA